MGFASNELLVSCVPFVPDGEDARHTAAGPALAEQFEGSFVDLSGWLGVALRRVTAAELYFHYSSFTVLSNSFYCPLLCHSSSLSVLLSPAFACWCSFLSLSLSMAAAHDGLYGNWEG